jgi:asparagine synthase (glutamine-hydrolysing)
LCGFSGVIEYSIVVSDKMQLLSEMGNSIIHRGPDDSGVFITEDNKLGLVHRRLAILDLSAAGHQPMSSKNEQFVLVFNGEIYNHLELRKELEKEHSFHWAGHSDTETLLAGIQTWGLLKTLTKSVGMFALALFDKSSRTLSLARDRAGEKPLYYGYSDGTLLFGSELKALKVHPKFDKSLDISSLMALLQYKYIPAPSTIYEKFKKLAPGTIITFSLDDPSATQTESYWSFDKVAFEGRQRLFQGSFEEATNCLEEKLSVAINDQMLADVPLGAFLSGGTDSTVITALMQENSHTPVKTFTVGFNEEQYNEANHAKGVAKHLGTDHTEIYVTEQDALNVIPSLARMYDEPFADSSQIPTFLISKEAKKIVTVALSGDGGDELFGGYTRYFRAERFVHKFRGIPKFSFATLANLKPFFLSDVWTCVEQKLGLHNSGLLSNNFAKLAELSSFGSVGGIYNHVISDFKAPELLLAAQCNPLNMLSGRFNHANISNIENMMLADSYSYLPDDVLVKVDRAAMAVSLETRVPMLDHRVIEFAWQLPFKYKVNGDNGKLLLKSILHKYVPQELVERPKTGFGVPVDSWLRGPLKDWAENLLSEHRIQQQGLFNTVRIRKYWLEHLSGKKNWQYILWNILMFQAWLEEQS